MNGRIRITKIKIGSRHRTDMGDLQTLAQSIKEQGLLQAIGITEDNELVFGRRRIEAAKLLGWKKIDAKIVNVTSIVEGEYAENELRKEFTKSERVAIAASLAEVLRERERRGNPEFQKLNDSTIQDAHPELRKGEQTRDFIAARVGLGSGRTYQQAKVVVEKGTEELVTAMDAGLVSAEDAFELSLLATDEQRTILKKPQNEISRTAKELRKQRRQLIPKKIENLDMDRIQSAAYRWATMAISYLDHINRDDPYRPGALDKVQKWLDENK